MDKNYAIEMLKRNFDKLIDNHLDTLRFLVSQLYRLFDSIITISVAVVGIIVPIILNSHYSANTNFLWVSFCVFVLVILIGISWRFSRLKTAEHKWPKILEGAHEAFHQSVLEIRQTSSNNLQKIIEKNFQSGINKNTYRTKIFEIFFVSLFCLGIILLAFSLLPIKMTYNSPSQKLNKVHSEINSVGECCEMMKESILEQLQNVSIPSYFDKNQLTKMRNGEILIKGPASEEFPNGINLWAANLDKNTNSFVIADFNKDGLDDVAHVIGYTGFGSGYFYRLTIFINDQGKLKYLA